MKEARKIVSLKPRGDQASQQPYNPALNPGNTDRVRPFETGTPGSQQTFGLAEDLLSENGFNFVGTDSLNEKVKGFVQTTNESMVPKELERAGIRVHSISPRRGGRTNRRKPTRVEFASLAEQFGDLMEIGESPTQICRLLAYAQTNQLLADALFNAGDLIINGRSLSEAFSAQLDSTGEPLFPVTFICALRIGEEVGTAADSDTGADRSAFLLTLHRFAEAEKKAAAI